MTAHVPDVRLKITTYQQPHHQYMYIPYHSFHRHGVFKGFIKAELQCYAVTNTLPADFLHMKSLLLQGLLERGYPLHRLASWFAEVDHSCRVPLLLRPRKRHCLAGQPPVLVLSNGQFEMTAHVYISIIHTLGDGEIHVINPSLTIVICQADVGQQCVEQLQKCNQR
jgi:hypothetical protein